MSKPSALWLQPDWDLPSGINAAITTVDGGVSEGGYASLNLAQHVGDEPAHVAENRKRLTKALGQALGLQQEPVWLNQVHGTRVVACEPNAPLQDADASVSRVSGLPSAVLTADCLPVLFYAKTDKQIVVAAAHAGWRGLLNGVLENTLQAMSVSTAHIHCYLGPAIGPEVFQIGAEVKAAFLQHDKGCEKAFVADSEGRFLADIYHLAGLRLQALGVASVAGGGLCTVGDKRFYSYRGAGVDAQGQAKPCGRFASLIWFN